MPRRSRALAKAIRVAGGPTALGKAIGHSRQGVWNWRECPPDWVLKVEAATNGEVTRSELRPDLYPPESKRKKA